LLFMQQELSVDTQDPSIRSVSPAAFNAALGRADTPLVLARAQTLGAVAYDIPGAPVSHVGELCSFDALLLGFDLVDAALDLAAQSAGLLAVSLGLSRLHAADDHAMLEAALPLYDALYAWCRDRVTAQDEAHNWKPETLVGAPA
jgi:hypothetical protein